MSRLNAKIKVVLAMAIAPASSLFAQTPQHVSATFDDWTASCSLQKQGELACEAVHFLRLPNQRDAMGQITVSSANKSDPYKVFIQIPPNVRLAQGVKLVLDEKDPPVPVTLEWCLPSRCLADAELPELTLKALAARTEPGEVEYTDATQTAVTIPVSFKGFNPAFEWMERTSSEPTTTKPNVAQVCETQFDRLKQSGDLGNKPDETGFMAWCQGGLDKTNKQ